MAKTYNSNMATKITWNFIHRSLTKSELQDWQALCVRSQNLSASSTDVFAKHAEKLIKGSNVFFAFGYCEQQLVVALPLVIKSTKKYRIPFNYLQVAIHDHLDYFIAAGQSELNEQSLIDSLLAACRANVEGWDWFFSRRWFFETALNQRNISQSYTRKSAYFDLKNDTEITQVISKKLLKNLVRFEKKLASDNQSINLLTATTETCVDESMKSFYEIESAGWKGEVGSAIALNSEIRDFYQNVWQGFSKRHTAIIYELQLNQATIAGCIAFRHRSTIFLHKITYDEKFAKNSPGSILVKRIIEECLLHPEIHRICFNTNPPWIQRWHPQIDELVAVQGFNSNLKGLLIRLAVSLYYQLRRINRYLKSASE